MATLITVDGESSEVQATELAEMQALVGGYIEMVTFPDGSLMICNEGERTTSCRATTWRRRSSG